MRPTEGLEDVLQAPLRAVLHEEVAAHGPVERPVEGCALKLELLGELPGVLQLARLEEAEGVAVVLVNVVDLDRAIAGDVPEPQILIEVVLGDVRDVPGADLAVDGIGRTGELPGIVVNVPEPRLRVLQGPGTTPKTPRGDPAYPLTFFIPAMLAQEYGMSLVTVGLVFASIRAVDLFWDPAIALFLD